VSGEPPEPDALYRLLAQARVEAHAQDFPFVEYLLGVAMEDLSETLLRRGKIIRDEKERRI
jgi:hypothetical protein